MSMTEQSSVYALLINGSTVEIRPARPGDYDAVKAMHQAMSPDNAYLRFFSLSRQAAEAEARRICRPPRPGRAALLALDGAEVVGVGQLRGAGRAGPRPEGSRGRVRGGRPDAPRGNRDAAAGAPGLVRQEPWGHHVHRADAGREHGDAEGHRGRRPAGAPSDLPRGGRPDHPAARPRRRHGPGQLPERSGRTGARGGRGQPAARVRARVGRGDRRQPGGRGRWAG